MSLKKPIKSISLLDHWSVHIHAIYSHFGIWVNTGSTEYLLLCDAQAGLEAPSLGACSLVYACTKLAEHRILS